MLKQFSTRIIVFYAISLAFIFLSLYFTLKKDLILVNALPIVLAIILLALYSADKVLMLIVLLTPVSLPLRELVPSLSFDMFLPTEPLLFGILLLFILKLPSNQGIRREIWVHPVSITIWIYLVWLVITTLTSTMPMVSLKFTLVKIWFIVGFYLMGIMLFEKRANFHRFVWLYVASFLLVIAYAISRHVGYGLLDKQAAHFVMTPFYNDHTSYGAVMALFIPFITLFSFSGQYKPWVRWVARIVLVILIIAFILSYSRAAWLSLFAGTGVWIMMKLKIRFRTVIIALVSLIAFVFVFEKQVVMYLERNNEESSNNLKEHFSSMSNISTDASNLERINRWSCAIRMFRDKPAFGYGPGTYMFQYAPYQLTKDRTIISTNSGDVGGAHSEYLGPLSESGLLGMLSVLAIFITVIYIAFRTYNRLRDPYLRGILLAAFIGLVTYYFHGFLNNFLDTDKASVPFWGFTAMIVAIDYYSRKETLLHNP